MRLIPTCATLILASTLATSVLAAEPAMDEAARMQYALGYQLGRDLGAIEPRPQDLLKGVEDGRAGAVRPEKPGPAPARRGLLLAGRRPSRRPRAR